ncbi:bifunctional 2-polyprenyl-6-hydroxyphenol methylase/3-demethylubiquinol 3-O-methyltransferase UbiG [Gordonia sp. OPL2]|uniref:class I SAM-dependent methyltransferase n=1 Tax=Gordonia sp. OPL2 TaxID=2486274 RepID=UPI00165637BC|nr:class I SAM-dependent methyltransferase [Gordonia sp. OPL2]RPA19919.1 class I SAM-dependent methyltransferase [Gordonia sp. OPL2]
MATRWDESNAPRGDRYDERWARLAASGQSVHGEAALIDSLVRDLENATILDAGCGTGRVAIELNRRGHEVVGTDIDESMLATARRKAPEIDWLLADLAHLGDHVDATFDVAVLAGNVMIFVDPGTEARVVEQVTHRLVPHGLLVAGFQVRTDRLPIEDYDRYATAAGLELVARWATWDREPYTGGDYAVSVHRRIG